jgi:hypothetical protein
MSSLKETVNSYSAIGVGKLTAQQETYVQRRAIGMNPSAAARMAGYRNVKKALEELALIPEIEDAICYLREAQRQTAIDAGAIEFTKDNATALYLAAHAKAEDAQTEIRAVDSLVKLHGLAAPEKKEIQVTSREQLKGMSDEQLMSLAGKDIQLDPSQYVEVTADE